MSSVTLVHPAKGRNELPFGRDTRVVPSNTVLDRVPLRKGRFGGRNPQFACSNTAYRRITLARILGAMQENKKVLILMLIVLLY